MTGCEPGGHISDNCNNVFSDKVNTVRESQIDLNHDVLTGTTLYVSSI